MFQLLALGGANIKAYLYGAVICVFLIMCGTIWHLNSKVDSLTAELATTKLQLQNSKSLIAKMIGSEKISDDVDNYIDTGISIMLSEHQSVEDQLRKEYEAYLIENGKEEMCKGYCDEIKEDIFCPTNPVDGVINSPGKPSPLPNRDDAIKKKMLEAAWKNYCLNNRLAEGCKQ